MESWRLRLVSSANRPRAGPGVTTVEDPIDSTEELTENTGGRTPAEDKQRLRELRGILTRSRGRGQRELTEDELRNLPRLYRFASSLYARLETQGRDEGTLDQTRDLLRRAHGQLYRGAGQEAMPWYRRVWQTLMVDSPRAMRAEWKLFSFTFAVFYAIAIGAYVAVTYNLELAFTLFHPEMVATEISQLEATPAGEPFRGNFTFDEELSSFVAFKIMAHNIGVCVLYFASGLAVPMYIYVLFTNAMMLGVYTAVAAHWSQGTAISSILWCHGVLEIQAIIIAGLAGLILLRAWVAPGPWTRTHAMKLELPRALHILAPAFAMLVFAGLIEGYVSPHAPVEVRLSVASLTGVAFLAWLFAAGRGVTTQSAHEPHSRS